MIQAKTIVHVLLEDEEDDFDPKAEIERMGILPLPKIMVSFSRHRFHDDQSGDYDEEHGWEDEEGTEFEVDEFDEEAGVTLADKVVHWLHDNGAMYPSSSYFHPGIWYGDEAEADFRTGWSEEKHYHLAGFSEEDERAIFDKLTKVRQR